MCQSQFRCRKRKPLRPLSAENKIGCLRNPREGWRSRLCIGFPNGFQDTATQVHQDGVGRGPRGHLRNRWLQNIWSNRDSASRHDLPLLLEPHGPKHGRPSPCLPTPGARDQPRRRPARPRPACPAKRAGAWPPRHARFRIPKDASQRPNPSGKEVWEGCFEPPLHDEGRWQRSHSGLHSPREGSGGGGTGQGRTERVSHAPFQEASLGDGVALGMALAPESPVLCDPSHLALDLSPQQSAEGTCLVRGYGAD